MRAPPRLSRRERQILDALYRLGSATAVELAAVLDDAPTSTTLRGLLRILERKGQVRHRLDGPRFIYSPVHPKLEMGAATIRHVVRTFFEGSPARAMAALLGTDQKMDEVEIREIETMIRRARRKSP